jgi:hypothetical protein
MSNPTYNGSKGQVSAIGATISIGAVTGTTGSDTFAPVGEITDLKLGGRQRATVDVTNFGSGGNKRILGGVMAWGTATVTVTRVSNDPGQLAVIAANLAGVAYDFQLQFPVNTKAAQTTTGDQVVATGIVTEVNFDFSLTKATDLTFTIEWDGPYTITAGS